MGLQIQYLKIVYENEAQFPTYGYTSYFKPINCFVCCEINFDHLGVLKLVINMF